MEQKCQNGGESSTAKSEEEKAFEKLQEFAANADKAEWLRTQYTEAWGQYQHEDNIAESRNRFFITIQGVLVAFLGAMCSPLIQSNRYSELEAIMVGVGFFLLLLSILWILVTTAGQRCLNMRWTVAKAIETAICLNDVGLAGTEDRWRKQKDRWAPYGEKITDQIDPPLRIGGWKATRLVAYFMIVLWIAVIVLGAYLLSGNSEMPDSNDAMLAALGFAFRIVLLGTGFGLAILAYKLFCKTKQFGGQGEGGKCCWWVIPLLFLVVSVAAMAIAVFRLI